MRASQLDGGARGWSNAKRRAATTESVAMSDQLGTGNLTASPLALASTSQPGDTLNAPTEPSQDPAVQGFNAAILDLHADLEDFAHETGTNDVFHSLINTGETAGLGHIGESGLITDIAQA